MRSITGTQGFEGQQNPQIPQTSFTKLMSIPQTVPTKQCKFLLDTMKEECLFEKKAIIETKNIKIPLSATLEKQKNSNHIKYRKLVDYCKKKKQQQDFAQQNLSVNKILKKRIKTLNDVVQNKKIRMLTQENKYEQEDENVKILLDDNKQRQSLFDQAILMERFYRTQKEERLTQEQKMAIPSKFKGLDPKHLRIPQKNLNQQSYNKRKYVHHMRTFQYFKNAIRIEKNMNKTKQTENNMAINKLMSHVSIVSQKKKSQSGQSNLVIHRLFLRFANSESEDLQNMYKSMSKDSLKMFFSDFEIDFQKCDQIVKILENNQQISEFYFYEIIHCLSLRHSNTDFYTNTKDFLDMNVLKYPHKYLPQEWVKYETQRSMINRHMKIRRFKESVKRIYDLLIKSKTKKNTDYLNFDELVEVMWQLKIYPFMVNKKKLRFYYLYSQNNQLGLSLDLFGNLFVFIGLGLEGDPWKNFKNMVNIVVKFYKQ